MKFDWSIAATMGVVVAIGIAASFGRNLKGADMAIFAALLALIAIAAGAAIVYFKSRPKQKAAAGGAAGPAQGGDAEIDTLIREADQRLASANAGATIANLPLIFVIGDRSTAKTSTVVNSGIEPELLAGQVYQDNMIGPTRAANLWFARGTALMESGGPILGDPAKWLALVKRLQPGKLKSLKGGAQSPRAVLLCVSLEAFTTGGPDAIAATARYLQARLAEVAQTLGIRFPVYILFTKTDRVPFFTEFVGTFNNEESTQVFGVTVPMLPAKQTGVYAEDESRRLTAYFDNLFYSLCDKRTVFPPRDNDVEKVCGAYEFPRELRKVRDVMIRFMVDVCRPSQLTTSPFLRGFYFSGVRPIVVSDAAPIVASRPQQADFQGTGASGATGMFRVGKQAEMIAQQAVAQPAATSRKVPQWMFLGHLFNGIILSDSAAMAASGSSVKVSALRRGLLIAASAICLILSVIFLISFLGNRGIETTALKAATHIDTKDLPAGKLPTLENLQQLENLRQTLETLDGYETDGAPTHLRWGLYPSTPLYDAVYALYFKRFHALLFGQTQAGLLRVMQGLKAPAGETDDWFRPYDSLKGYLLTTGKYNRDGQSDEPTRLPRGPTKMNAGDKILPAFLGKLLLDRRSENRDPKDLKDLSDLAKLQFDYYAQLLGEGNPYADVRDDATVKQIRDYLRSFTGPKRLYYGMLNEAKKQKPALSFNQYAQGSAATLESAHAVAYPFTQEGSAFMLEKIKGSGQSSEPWVLPDAGRTVNDLKQMQTDILKLYTTDYIAEWRTVLKTSHVVKYKDLNDAAAKLDTLTSGEAPLLRVIWWTTKNTALPSMPDVNDAFKAVHDAEPANADTWVKPQNDYNEALSKLQTAVKSAADAKGDSTALKGMQDMAESAKATTKTIYTQLTPDLDGKINNVVYALMLEPINFPGPEDELNKAGAGFCDSFSKIMRRFPFTRGANDTERTRNPLTLQEISAIFKPKDGKLWTTYESSLKKVIDCSGGDCKVVDKPPVRVNPEYVRFINQAVKFSRALYGDSGTDPKWKFSLKPKKVSFAKSFEIEVNGQVWKTDGDEQMSFVWPGTGKQDFVLKLDLGLGPLPIKSFDGLWGVFRFLADANRFKDNGSTYDFFWNFRSGQGADPEALEYAFTVDTNGVPIFNSDLAKCVPTVALSK